MRTFKFMCLLLAGLTATGLSAQGPYVNIRAGYAFPVATTTLPGFYNLNVQGQVASYEQVRVSLGKGINYGADLGFMFNENIGVQLGLDYLIGGKSKARFTNGSDYDNREIWSTMFRINPALMYILSSGGVRPYGRLGLMLGKGTIHSTSDQLDGNDKTYVRYKANGGMACGWNAAFGLMFALSANTSFFGELNLITMSYAPKTQVITEYTENGADRLPTLTTRQKQTDYFKEYSVDNNPPSYEPTKALKQKMGYNSLAINIGLKFDF